MKETPSRKVVRIIARLNVGGPALHCLTLSRLLNEEGYETVLIAGVPSETEEDYTKLFGDKMQGFRMHTLSRLKRAPTYFGDLLALFEIVSIVRKEKPDVVHTHTAKAGMLGRVAAFLCRVPVVIHTFHGHVLSGYFSKPVSRLIAFIERALAWKTTKIVTLSPTLAHQLSRDFGVAPAEKFSIISLGRNLDSFLTHPRGAGKLRHELGLNPDVSLIGTVGRLVPIKNQALLLEACADLSMDWRLVIVGEGDLAADLKRRAGELGISDKVFFLGWRSDLENLYSDFDVFALTSLNEGTPLSIIESFAAGCPSLSTNVGGVRDLYRVSQHLPDGSERCEEGYLVPTCNRDALTRGLECLLKNRNLRNQMSEKARTRALDFTDRKLAKNIAQLYNEQLLKREPVLRAQEVAV